MKVLLLRPEGSEIPYNSEIHIVNIPVLSPVCVDHILPINPEAIGFTSVNAVKCFKYFDKIRSNTRIYAVGPSTAKAIEKLYRDKGVRIPDTYTVDSMVKKILEDFKDQANIALVRSKVGYERDKGTYPNIVQIVDYDLIINHENLREVKELLSKCEYEFVVVTSSLIAKLVRDYIKECTKVISIGPSTTKALEGVNNIYEAKEHDMDGVFTLLKELLRDD
ncbi:uroporphyrinogen-III synthase [Stygiolobus caldivivus]|uniref:Tetrapyrrole biosynthesis uroporphyrinogen III synthase domain-containing protein n=1 Tax=Stygiolobus caldivivus TaxID=2824673 RepID=A0A8D5U6U1_9CREN|nr:uroporphyrinogen-III synthase [Stygiolobus caldivivus]BCU70384.1 hypothetical protein KN1_16810 [Stygiolobus caldivivus]